MKARTRHTLLAGALVVTVVATVMAPESKHAVVSAAPKATASSTDRVRVVSRSADAGEAVLAIRPRDEFDPIDSAFVSTKWDGGVEDAPALEESGAEALADMDAPALPFRLLGRYVEDGKTSVFLQYGNDAVVAREGEVIDETYRIDAVAEDAITFFYLPMEIEQQLPIDTQDQ